MELYKCRCQKKVRSAIRSFGLSKSACIDGAILLMYQLIDYKVLFQFLTIKKNTDVIGALDPLSCS